MANFYAGRETVKHALKIDGSGSDSLVDRHIGAASRDIDRLCLGRVFIPRTQTRAYRWPPLQTYRSHILDLDFDLISVTTLQTKAQDSSPTTIAASDYFLEPVNEGPPYTRIEIDLSSNAAFEPGDTPQRAIEVTGSWGYGADTVSAGTVASGLASSATATEMVCSNAGLIEVGHTLLIEAEQVFVSGRAYSDLGANIDGALNATKSQEAVTVEGGHGLADGEVILVDSERMLIRSITANVLQVIRAYDGTTLASHSDASDIYVGRTLTIERGMNGTTAATHANATAASRYTPPADIETLCVALALAKMAQDLSSWGRSVGAGESPLEVSGKALENLKTAVVREFARRSPKAAAV